MSSLRTLVNINLYLITTWQTPKSQHSQKIRSDPAFGGGMGNRGVGIQAFAFNLESCNRTLAFL